MSRSPTKYLLWFAQEHLDFRFAEIESLLSLFKIEMRHVEKADKATPYWIVEFCNENDAKQIATRSVTIRFCLELWAHAKDISNLHSKLRNYPQALMAPHLQANKSFKIEVETFCKHFTQQEKVDKIETFSYLPVQGPVKLKNPDVCLQYVEYYGHISNYPPDNPYDVFFGRVLATGLRQLKQKLSLKTRKFIGNTSMDPQLSLLMANQARVATGDVILDPFVGSGSLLVAAAEFGAYVVGGDIDYLMLHAKNRPSRIKQEKRAIDESVKANLKQYNLEHRYLDVLVTDFSVDFWRDDMEFDAIITDPPYGIREATEKVGTKRANYKVSEEHLPTHIPAKVGYGISHLYTDLLDFAARHLRLAGRLVCWFPVFREDYQEEGLPQHSCLKLVANSEQVLSRLTSRRLLTFEKYQTPSSDGVNTLQNSIKDFRSKYYEAREESRQQRRLREAETRNENWIRALKNKKK